MIPKKTLVRHILFWLLTVVDSSFIASWLAQQNIYKFNYQNKLGLHYLAFELVKDLPTLLLHITICYVNLLLLSPYFFKTKKYVSYVLVLLLITGCFYLPIRFGIEDSFYKWLGGTGLTHTNKIFWITDSAVYAFRLYF